jgi:hypothetical protein
MGRFVVDIIDATCSTTIRIQPQTIKIQNGFYDQPDFIYVKSADGQCYPIVQNNTIKIGGN